MISVLPDHPRRNGAAAVLVGLEPGNVAIARDAAARGGLTQVELVEGDASFADVYAEVVPADLVLVCGIFSDVESAVHNLSMRCRAGASVLWTRYRREPDLTPRIRRWFAESGSDELSFDALQNETKSGIDAARLVGAPAGFEPGFHSFTVVH